MFTKNKVLFQVKKCKSSKELNEWLKDNNDIVWSVKLMTETELGITILYEAKE